MNSKKFKSSLSIIVVSIILFMFLGIIFRERISDFTSGFIVGVSFTLIVGAILFFWVKFFKK